MKEREDPFSQNVKYQKKTVIVQQIVCTLLTYLKT